MSTDRSNPTRRDALVSALAGTVFAVGVFACAELASLALTEARGAFRTWGPVGTVAAAGGLLLIGLPAALLIEALSRRSPHRAATALAAYAVALLAVWLAMWQGWNAFVGPARPASLVGELVVLAVAALSIWGGARLADRPSPGPVPLLAFGACALFAVLVATLVVTS